MAKTTRFSYTFKNTAGVNINEAKKHEKSLAAYRGQLDMVVQSGGYDAPESSLNVVTDDEIHTMVREAADAVVSDKLKYVVVIGIGGSNLGAAAVYEALIGKGGVYTDRQPKLLFADTVSTKRTQMIIDTLSSLKNEKEFVLNVISKSGATTETMANFNAIYNALQPGFKNIDDRVVVTTGHGSALWEAAGEQGFKRLSVPKTVGGRYSVFSAVGLYPLMLAGIHTEKLIEGAKDMRKLCLIGGMKNNPAAASAILTFMNAQDGRGISNTFLFNPEMESVGKWYRQLMGESVGKEKDLQGKVVKTGVTPIVSIGSTDLHSMAQLYFGGPRDKFTTFVYAPQRENEIRVPEKPVLDTVEGAPNRTLGELMNAIYEGVKAAYRKNKLPHMEIELSDISAYTVGQFLQFKMMEMMYLAQLMNVNAFDQPSVEDYKAETRKIIG